MNVSNGDRFLEDSNFVNRTGGEGIESNYNTVARFTNTLTNFVPTMFRHSKKQNKSVEIRLID